LIESRLTGAVAAIGHKGLVSLRGYIEARRLLSDCKRGDELWRCGLEVDDMDLVIKHLLQSFSLLDHIDGVRHERERTIRRDREIHRRTDDRVLERQISHNLGRLRLRKVNDHDVVAAGC